MRILYIQANVTPPPVDPQVDRFYLLSKGIEGDVLQPAWYSTPEQIESAYGPGSFPVYTAGRFRYHWFLCARYRGIRRRLAIFRFYITKGWELCRRQHFDCIVAYSHMTTGLLAGMLKILNRSKLVIEIATTPHLIYLTDRPRPTWKDRLMHLYSDLCLYLAIGLADRVHLLSPDQLSAYPLLRRVRNSVFHEFTPVSIVDRPRDNNPAEQYVLLVGAPWYLKGVDLLISAFLRLAADYPHVKLKIMGHFPDRDGLMALTGGSPQIEILKPCFHNEALAIISRATVVVLPSRCEGMGRVLIEGMAAGVPLIGSDVGGIPFVIQNGENGFVFPNGNVTVLAARLNELLADPELRRRMGENGYRRAHTELNEEVYVEKFTKMVEATVQNEI